MSLEGEEYEKMGLVSSEVKAEWKMLSNQKKTQEDPPSLAQILKETLLRNSVHESLALSYT